MPETNLFETAQRCFASGEVVDEPLRRFRERRSAELFWTACGLQRPHHAKRRRTVE